MADTIHWRLQNGTLVREDVAPFSDTIEMAGKQIAAIVTYGTDAHGGLRLSRQLVYPQLHTIPRDTFGTLHCPHGEGERQTLLLDGAPIEEHVAAFALGDGSVAVRSADRTGALTIRRRLFPCTDRPCYIEHTWVKNTGTRPVRLSADAIDTVVYHHGAAGVYADRVQARRLDRTLLPGDTADTALVFSCVPFREALPQPDIFAEWAARQQFAARICDGTLRLRCDDPALTQFFRLAKLRAAESIFTTAAGPLHSPGGGPYYAAVWANDQVEYAAPFFPFLGYGTANTASLCACDLFSRFMSPDGLPIPSSVIDEGRDIWQGAGDRGDAAMVLYGASRLLLALGDRAAAEERFWMLAWAADFCLSRKTADGVIASDSDELEERLPSGNANLCTSCLTYGGLLSAADLATDLGHAQTAAAWRAAAEELRAGIDRYFAAEISGFPTYRYYDGNTVLRSWISIPLTVGIFGRAVGTVDALLSDRLFFGDGCLSAEGDVTYWDRSTLYAFRGILNAGSAERVYPYIQSYVQARLLGAHVPYAVEAWPEGDQRQLSAESALFCRVVTEGMFGLCPVGLRRLRLSPSVPPQLCTVTLERVHLCGAVFDLTLTRTADAHTATLRQDGQPERRFTIPLGAAVEIALPENG